MEVQSPLRMSVPPVASRVPELRQPAPLAVTVIERPSDERIVPAFSPTSVALLESVIVAPPGFTASGRMVTPSPMTTRVFDAHGATELKLAPPPIRIRPVLPATVPMVCEPS